MKFFLQLNSKENILKNVCKKLTDPTDFKSIFLQLFQLIPKGLEQTEGE